MTSEIESETHSLGTKTPTPSQPIPQIRLNEIANGACDTTFQFVDSYEHSRTSSWNTSIINTILQSLISDSTPTNGTPSYKFAVTSTIIQHTKPSRLPQTFGEKNVLEQTGTSADNPTIGRRGMHSATGAYWNNEKDGMWSFKYEGGESKGFDVVISVIWISVV